jgi:hypothetical protein
MGYSPVQWKSMHPVFEAAISGMAAMKPRMSLKMILNEMVRPAAYSRWPGAS